MSDQGGTAREGHIKKVLQAISRINRLIITERDEKTLIQSACLYLTDIDSYYSALIVLFDADQNTRASACSGEAPELAQLRERVEEGYKPECVVSAMTTDRIVTIAHAEHCQECPLSRACAQHHAMSGALCWDNRTYGVLTVSTDHEVVESEEERSIFTELLGDIAYALHKIEAERLYEKSHLALVESEERFRLLAEYSPQIIYLCRNDANYSMLFLNHAIEFISGYARELFLTGQMPFIELYHPDDRAGIVRDVDEAVAHNRPFKLTYRMCCKDGSVRWMEEYGGIVPMADGEILLVGTIHDITERREEAIERERLFMAIEQLAETVLITDAHGAIQYVNAGFEQSSGYAREEAIGQNPRMLKSGKQDEAFYQAMWQEISSGRTWTGTLHNRRRDGTEYEEEAIISPIRDATGRITNYVAVKRDVTTERTLHKQLIQSQKMEAVGLLAGGIAHDFNNLLTVIMSAAGFLQSALPEDAPGHDDVEEILKSARRAAELTRQLLAFSRRQIMVPKHVDLNHVVANMERLLRRVVPENIQLDFVYHQAPLAVRVDAGQLEQVILNLVVNARDALGEKGRLSVATARAVPRPRDCAMFVDQSASFDAEMAVIRVLDNGCGISEDKLPHIFEPFYSTKPVGAGTGLGLPTAQGIARQHGGAISVESRVGEGTTMHVFIPLDKETNLEAEDIEQASLTLKGEETLLVVEDEPGVRRVIMRMLSDAGYTIILAESGAEALEKARAHEGPIHLLLSDMVMPSMSGAEVAEQVRALYPDIKVLFASGYPESHLTQAGLDVDARSLIRKPFNRAELAKAIRELLD